MVSSQWCTSQVEAGRESAGSKLLRWKSRLQAQIALANLNSRWKDLYLSLLGYVRTMYQICKLVHADLSEYNLLYHAERIYIIDVSQSVEHDHPRSLEFLRMDIKNISEFFKRKRVDTLSERAVFKFVIEVNARNDTENMRAELLKMYENRDPDQDDEADTGVDDEVFRQQYIPQTLEQVYDIERDGEKLKQSNGDETLVYQNLLAEKQSTGLQNSDTDEGSEDDDADDSDASSDGEHSTDPKQPRGKRFEDKDAKKAHKQAVKEEKREKRKEKMPKHVKKKLVNQSSRGKKK
jgi:RIO kinase 1